MTHHSDTIISGMDAAQLCRFVSKETGAKKTGPLIIERNDLRCVFRQGGAGRSQIVIDCGQEEQMLMSQIRGILLDLFTILMDETA